MTKRNKIVKINLTTLPGSGDGPGFTPIANKDIKTEPGETHIKLGQHAVKQFFKESKELTLFSDHNIEAFAAATGQKLIEKPNSYGIVLNQSQWRVFEGIMSAFSASNYSGDRQIDRGSLFKEIFPDTEDAANILTKGDNAPYKNIPTIPLIQLTQSRIIQLAGYDLKKQRRGDKEDVIDAIKFLSTKQFCFCWGRLKMGSNNKPELDEYGNYEMEEVAEVGTLLRIRRVSSDLGELQYYEISPSAVLLDQYRSHFILLPDKWRDDVRRLTGKKASRYTDSFLLWLRLQFEQIRRFNSNKNHKKKRGFILNTTWEQIAENLKMPESMYKANRKKAIKIIKNAYAIALKLGYLVQVEESGAGDILHLNEDFYPKPGSMV